MIEDIENLEHLTNLKWLGQYFALNIFIIYLRNLLKNAIKLKIYPLIASKA